MTTAPKSVLIKTFGCQMNVYDSERMREALSLQGYAETQDVHEASLVLLNTCHIREHAAEKLYSELGRLKALKRRREDKGESFTLAVTGCVAQAEGGEILRRAPNVDLVIGPQSYHHLTDLVSEHLHSRAKVVATDFPADDKFETLNAKAPRRAHGAVTAFLTVQEGCDKFCTFCVVPYTRGAEFSRPAKQVVSEARALAAQGVREVTLLGQNVNAYHGVGEQGRALGLADLIAELATIEGLERIRYMTSHPNDMDDALIEAHGQNQKLMPFLHLPVQSGSDKILKAMNRGHSAEDYLKLIARVRSARPDIALSGDFITGFPGESPQDFEDTLSLVREVRYASAYAFRYSARPGTPAANLEPQIPYEVSAERLQRLLALIQEQTQSFNQSLIGKTLPILIERPGRHEGQMGGRSPYLQAVHVSGGSADVGEMRNVRIEALTSNSLSGRYEIG